MGAEKPFGGSLPFALTEDQALEFGRELFRRLGLPVPTVGGPEARPAGVWQNGDSRIVLTGSTQVYEEEPGWPTEFSSRLTITGIPGVRALWLATPKTSGSATGFLTYGGSGDESATQRLLKVATLIWSESRTGLPSRWVDHPTLPPQWRRPATSPPPRIVRTWSWLAGYELVRDDDPPIIVTQEDGRTVGSLARPGGSILPVGALPAAAAGAADGGMVLALRRFGRGGRPNADEVFPTLVPNGEKLHPTDLARAAGDDEGPTCFLGLVEGPRLTLRLWRSGAWWIRQSLGFNRYGGKRSAYAIQHLKGGDFAFFGLYEVFSPESPQEQRFYGCIVGAEKAAAGAHTRLTNALGRRGWQRLDAKHARARGAKRRGRTPRSEAASDPCECESGSREPDQNPAVTLLDSHRFLESQFSADGFNELWRCTRCERRWLIEIYRAGSVRNADVPSWAPWPKGKPDRFEGS